MLCGKKDSRTDFQVVRKFKIGNKIGDKIEHKIEVLAGGLEQQKLRVLVS